MNLNSDTHETPEEIKFDSLNRNMESLKMGWDLDIAPFYIAIDTYNACASATKAMVEIGMVHDSKLIPAIQHDMVNNVAHQLEEMLKCAGVESER